MTNFAFAVSDHATHSSHPDDKVWVRNMGNHNLIITDAGHSIPRKACAGMSEMDATTKALVDDGSLVICSAPAATPPPIPPKGKSRSPKKETPTSDAESGPADSGETVLAEEESKSEEPSEG